MVFLECEETNIVILNYGAPIPLILCATWSRCLQFESTRLSTLIVSIYYCNRYATSFLRYIQDLLISRLKLVPSTINLYYIVCRIYAFVEYIFDNKERIMKVSNVERSFELQQKEVQKKIHNVDISSTLFMLLI